MAERSVGASIARGVGRGTRWTGRKVRGEVVRRVGGAARARVIVIFGLVLALNGAAIEAGSGGGKRKRANDGTTGRFSGFTPIALPIRPAGAIAYGDLPRQREGRHC